MKRSVRPVSARANACLLRAAGRHDCKSQPWLAAGSKLRGRTYPHGRDVRGQDGHATAAESRSSEAVGVQRKPLCRLHGMHELVEDDNLPRADGAERATFSRFSRAARAPNPAQKPAPCTQHPWVSPPFSQVIIARALLRADLFGKKWSHADANSLPAPLTGHGGWLLPSAPLSAPAPPLPPTPLPPTLPPPPSSKLGSRRL